MATVDTESRPEPPDTGAAAPVTSVINGVVIGLFIGFDAEGAPLVAYPGNPTETGLPARATTLPTAADLGREVALLFEGGDPRRPLLIGLVQRPERRAESTPTESVDLDDERIVLRAEREIVLKCGKASITLTRAGKVLIRGAYLLSRSSGVNRIKGGSVQIN
jgi:hypothetical protein